MKYTIYQITNKINNKIYVGYHQTDDLHDNYMGSGTAIKKALDKYGRENFRKDVLHVFKSLEEMLSKEVEIVDETFVKRRDTYNQVTGGVGGRINSDETKRKMSESTKGYKQSDSHKRKIGEGNSKRVLIKGVEYFSITEASRELNVLETTVAKRLHSHIENGYNFVENPIQKRRPKPNKTSAKPVMVEGVKYKSCIDAANTLGITKGCLHGRMKSPNKPDYYYL